MVTMSDVAYNVASDLVREYMRAEDNGDINPGNLYNAEDYKAAWRAAVRSCATRMGVYPVFCELLEGQMNETTGNS